MVGNGVTELFGSVPAFQPLPLQLGNRQYVAIRRRRDYIGGSGRFFHATSKVDYKFKVHNNTKVAITKILVSEDGKKWGFFDIGDGIAPGATEELVWDKSTDNGNCEQYFKAVFANGEESEPVEFDFCEKNLTLEF